MTSTTRMELTMLLRSGRVFWTALIFALIVLCSSVFMLIRNSELDAYKNKMAQIERDRWLNQEAKDAHDAAHHSVYIFKNSLPLHSLDPGIQPYLGQTVWLEPHWRNDMIYRPLQEAEPFQRMGQANPARFLIQFGPLFVFLVAFAATAADRERGAMRLALGAARRPGTYIWGKWSAVFALSAATLLLPALLVAGGATVAAFTLDNVLRLVAWFAVMGSYLAILAAIGIAVCFNAPTARLGFVGLLGIWVAFAFVMPPMASSNAERITPLPSYQAVQLVLEREAPIHWTNEQEQEQLKHILKKYGVKTPKELPVDLRGVLIDYNERHSHKVFDKHLGGFYDKVGEQDATFANQTWLSPAIAVYSASSAIAGSNFMHHRHFIDAGERYRRRLVNMMNHVLMTQSPAIGTGEYVMNAFKVGMDVFDDLEAFEYRGPKIDMAFRSTGLTFVGLVGWFAVGLFLVAFTARRARP